MIYDQWDIVLVRFPFTDLTSYKKRPGLIISPYEYNSGRDVIIAFITSNLKLKSMMGDYIIHDWQESGLPKPSMIRMKFATLDRRIIYKRLGRLTDSDIRRFGKALVKFLTV
jgi:mRNA interferase MazF